MQSVLIDTFDADNSFNHFFHIQWVLTLTETDSGYCISF